MAVLAACVVVVPRLAASTARASAPHVASRHFVGTFNVDYPTVWNYDSGNYHLHGTRDFAAQATVDLAVDAGGNVVSFQSSGVSLTGTHDLSEQWPAPTDSCHITATYSTGSKAFAVSGSLANLSVSFPFKGDVVYVGTCNGEGGPQTKHYDDLLTWTCKTTDDGSNGTVNYNYSYPSNDGIYTETTNITCAGALKLGGLHISGRITRFTGTPMFNQVVKLSGDDAQSTSTAADGTYSFAVKAGNYTVAPQGDGFHPASRTVHVASDTGGLDFTNILRDVVGKVVQIKQVGPGSPPRLMYYKDGKWYDAYEGFDFRVGDRLRTDGNTVAALEFVIGGRVGANKNSEIEIESEGNVKEKGKPVVKRIVIRQGGMWAKVAKRSDPLEIQTNGGVFGIKG